MLSRFVGFSGALVGAIALLASGIAAPRHSFCPVTPTPPPPQSYRLSAVALSPDGSRLAVGLPGGGVWLQAEPKGRIVVWDATEGTHLKTLEGHEEDVSALAFSPDGEYLLSASHDQTARLWDATDFEPVHVLASHASSIKSAAFSADGAYLVTGGADETARLWDVQTGNHLITLRPPIPDSRPHSLSVLSVGLSPEGAYALTGDERGGVWLWDTGTGEAIREFREDEEGRGRWENHPVTFLANGDRVASRKWDSSISVWERDTGTLVEERDGVGGRSPVWFSPGGAYVAAGLGGGGEVLVTKVETGETVFETEESGTGNVHGVAFSADAERMAVATQEGVVHLWDTVTGERVNVFDHHRFREDAEIDAHPKFE